ncbi:Choline-sulfatase [Escovopsis weberi]|uniref:Choline-sulfatase n=1 Tax=Escovopsis weberi TaxID=150374 RepID=A0A0M8N9D7_ESCWE|nr:Choline-sulfatase [Escovopsis weberi]
MKDIEPTALPSPGPDEAALRPNILYIMADQLAAPQLRMYNPESQIKTPNLDRLAASSVQFDSAYCPSPLCGPSRMSMISGLLPARVKAYDNASQISSEVPTYAHYLRARGYHTALAGKMHFVGDQLHGNQLDFDEEVLYRSTQYLWDHVREGPNKRPFCLTVSLTHPHDPYTITKKYWNLYEDVDIALPKVRIPKEAQDGHSKRLMQVCDLWDQDFSDEQIKRAKRAYYGSVSYVDDCVGRLLETLEDAGLADRTIVIFSGDHGDMLGERGLWYKMSYFESSVRVPMLVHYPPWFAPHRVSQNVSTLDLLPTICDLVGARPWPTLPMDGVSMMPHLLGSNEGGGDTVFAEYMGEGTVRPMMMIRRGPWKYITCPADEPQLFNLERDPDELDNLARFAREEPKTEHEKEARARFESFEAEAKAKWDFDAITEEVLLSQRNRRMVWDALKLGAFTSWDFDPVDDGRQK